MNGHFHFAEHEATPFWKRWLLHKIGIVFVLIFLAMAWAAPE